MAAAEGSGGKGGTVATATTTASTTSGDNGSGAMVVVLERLGGKRKVNGGSNKGQRRQRFAETVKGNLEASLAW